MQAQADFYGVAFLVAVEEASEKFAAGRFVEAVPQVGALPAVGGRDRMIHFHVQTAQVGDVLRRFRRVVEAVVRDDETFLVVQHNLPTIFIVRFT